MQLSYLSRYRSALMGFAILIVLLFHIDTPRADAFYGLRRMGNMGVDVFFFLSGVGLWYSWTRCQSLRRFYYNRALRIYPTWLLVAGYFYVSRFRYGYASYSLPFGGTGNTGLDSVIDLAGDVLVNWDFWLHDELTFWYVPAAMMMYLFAPLLLEAVRRWPPYRWMVVVPLMWCIIVSYVVPVHAAVGHIEIFWSRVPVFVLGIVAGEAVKHGDTWPKAVWPAVVAVFALALWACVWLEQYRHGRFPLYTERMLYIPLALTTMLLVAHAMPRVPRLERALAWIGGISLEVYLVHVEFVYKPLRALHLGYWPTALATLAIALPVAWVIAQFTRLITKRLKH